MLLGLLPQVCAFLTLRSSTLDEWNCFIHVSAKLHLKNVPIPNNKCSCVCSVILAKNVFELTFFLVRFANFMDDFWKSTNSNTIPALCITFQYNTIHIVHVSPTTQKFHIFSCGATLYMVLCVCLFVPDLVPNFYQEKISTEAFLNIPEEVELKTMFSVSIC